MTVLRKIHLTDSNEMNIVSKEDINGDFNLGVSVIQSCHIDLNNSSEENLISNETYIGSSTCTENFTGVQVCLKTDQNCIVYLDQSHDGTNWDITNDFEYYYSMGGKGWIIQSVTMFIRVRVTNLSTNNTTVFRLQTSFCPVLSTLPKSLDKKGRLKTTTRIIDSENEKEVYITYAREMKTMQPTRLIGTAFHDNTKDTNFWTETVTGSGSASQSGKIVLGTGATANSTVKYQSNRKARNIAGTINSFRGAVSFTSDATSDNVRRVGCFDSNNGFFFQLSGNTLSVANRDSGSDTIVSSGDFNGTYGNDFLWIIIIIV